MLNNKMAWHIHWWVSTQMTILNMPFHMKSNVLESFKYGDELFTVACCGDT